jgi:phenylalanyl-tRNA synthetase beta chain
LKTPVQWLGDYIDVDAIGFERLADILTMVGLEVEETHDSPIGPVYSTKVTPNRGDWMSIAGVAREAVAALSNQGGVAARSGSRLPTATLRAGAIPVPIRIDVPEWCPRYAAAIVEIAHPGVSPDWMQARLTAAGMRPINAVVDVTNYIMIELGQPLHAFDLDTMAGPEIIVRAAKPGETITTLDGRERVLTPQMMVIADRDKPSAVAGVMGSEGSEVSAATRRVLIESAHFDPMMVRAGAKSLGMSTDASYRFERHVDPNSVLPALTAAAQLMASLTGGKVLPGLMDVYPNKIATRTIRLRKKRAEDILGLDVGDDAYAALKALGFDWTDAGGALDVIVPTHRPDVVREIDVIEELGRMIGYGKLPETLPPARSNHGGHDSDAGKLQSSVRRLLIGQGLTEVFTHTLAPPSAFDDPATASRRVRPRMALSAELSGLRQSLIPNLLDTLGRNARQRNPEIAIFEVGKVFEMAAPGDYREHVNAAAVLQGDYTAVKGIAENLFAGLGVEFPDVEASARVGMHPNRCALLSIGGQVIGYIAEADPDMVVQDLDGPSTIGRIACFEIDLDAVALSIPAAARYRQLPKFPEITRDLAMLYDTETSYTSIERIAIAAAGPHVESVKLLSIYTGEKVEPCKKSVALRFTLRAADRTLTDADADAAIAAAQSALSEDLGATTR